MNIPDDRRYTKEHEWAQVQGPLVVVGITDYAQDQLGEVVYVELPSVGTSLAQNEPFGVVESTKSVSDLFAPVAGTVVAWEVKWDDGPYFYEFYVEDADAQLWEVKLWADDGEVFVIEAKDSVD